MVAFVGIAVDMLPPMGAFVVVMVAPDIPQIDQLISHCE
jgi:hypothetical protein